MRLLLTPQQPWEPRQRGKGLGRLAQSDGNGGRAKNLPLGVDLDTRFTPAHTPSELLVHYPRGKYWVEG